MKYPPDGLRYGSPRDLELTRQDEERCDRLRAWLKRLFRAIVRAARREGETK